MSTDDNVIATLKEHAETDELVAEHEVETLGEKLKELYNRFHGAVQADWNWIAHHFKREANDAATANPDDKTPSAASTPASQASEPSGAAPHDATSDPPK